MSALNVTTGKIDNKQIKEMIQDTTNSIVKVLNACLEHRDSDVTKEAIRALSNSLDMSMGDITIKDCSFTMDERKDKKGE